MTAGAATLPWASRHAGTAADPRRCPALGYPEFAFAGRSNVGKSSLLNALVGRRGLARVSSTPGRTRLLQFFVVNDAVTFVDLPGYGYAAVSRTERARWKYLVEGYLRTRAVLRGLVLILDVRRDPQGEERDLCAWLAENAIPCIVVATKCDKVGKAALRLRLEEVRGALGREAPRPLAFSAASGAGRADLWESLLALLTSDERARFAGVDA